MKIFTAAMTISLTAFSPLAMALDNDLKQPSILSESDLSYCRGVTDAAIERRQDRDSITDSPAVVALDALDSFLAGSDPSRIATSAARSRIRAYERQTRMERTQANRIFERCLENREDEMIEQVRDRMESRGGRP